MPTLIRGGRMLDPKNKRDGRFDVLISNGKISKLAEKIAPPQGAEVIDASSLWVLPGLVDAHVHLREPGQENSETIESGSRAAAVGGVTSLLAMANTRPPIDSPEKVRFVVQRARETSNVKVYPVGAVTLALEGRELADLAGMAAAGAKAFSDDGRCVMDSNILRRALEQSHRLGVPLIEHCEDENLSCGGTVNEGKVSHQLKVGGIPAASESVIVARDIELARLTGAAVHCAHISTADAVEWIRLAKRKKVPVTAETCPHYFTLTEEAVKSHRTHAKMKPPLRTSRDVEAVKEGLADGTLDIIATDHAPHDPESKAKDLPLAPFGIIGMGSMFALVYNELILKKVLSPLSAVAKVTIQPAKIFNLPAGHLSVGAPADVALFDPNRKWTMKAEDLASKSRNSPFIGRKFAGKIVRTLVNGRTVFQAEG